MTYMIYNIKGKILRTVNCPSCFAQQQVGNEEFIIKGKANDITQKIEFDGFDEKDQPINPRVVDKTPEEIARDNPPMSEIPENKKPAFIANEQWQGVLRRLDILENK